MKCETALEKLTRVVGAAFLLSCLIFIINNEIFLIYKICADYLKQVLVKINDFRKDILA